jgi:hypothetical protein
MKSALQRIKEERKSIDVRIGVVTHTLVAKKLKSDQHTKREASRPKKTSMQNENAVDDDLEEDD